MNAMVTVAPDANDWKTTASLTGDASWEPAHVASLQERVERNLRKIQTGEAGIVSGTAYKTFPMTVATFTCG